MSSESAVQRHYASDDIAGRLLAALTDAGIDLSAPTPADLAPVDQFHGRGLEATREVAEMLMPHAEERGLDIGCGIGGPARWIAWSYGCRIDGIDLTEAFCVAGQKLTALTGLADHVTIRQGSALALPFRDGTFDFAYSQNVVMNIADKAGFYAEAARVLKRGGRLALSNLCVGPAGEPIYPVPWAETPATSFLSTPAQTLADLQGAGLKVLEFRDVTDESRRGHERMREHARKHGAPTLGTHLLMGERMREMARNTARNVDEGRVIPIEVLCRKA
jgi:SAM-dependent methyltransferase